MGKTPKKAIKDGNEQLRTVEAPNVDDRQTQNLPRANLVGVQKRNTPIGKHFKSKLRSPAKVQFTKVRARTILKLAVDIDSEKSGIASASKMKPECNDESDAQLTVTEKDLKKDTTKPETEKINQDSDESKTENDVQNSSEEKNGSEDTSDKSAAKTNGLREEKNEEINEITEESDEKELNLKIGDSPSKEENETDPTKSSSDNSNTQQTENGTNSEDTSQLEPKMPETSEPKIKDKTKTLINPDDVEASFISYDSSIMLKDVKVKLNDVVKDNSKIEDSTNATEATSESSNIDVSFGRTLRNISGRRSISRLRNTNLREHRLSPDSSLFVNMSVMSSPDENSDCKILHRRTGLSGTPASNGSSVDRKRKFAVEDSNMLKKSKTEGESIFNSSFDLLRGLRRPIQVSTPNKEVSKFNVDSVNEEKVSTDQAEPAKRWCRVM